ncbi:MAG: 2-hydroxyacid dehydrogenase [Candidatus Daviesbacteria bacterium]|nr:2-hydroxyacid dehydrogenase [Candidatus Daviesbacteria bacterium]
MKFKKILLINISEEKLDSFYWKKLKNLAEYIVMLPKDSLQIQKELADTDCVLTGFQIDVGKKEIDAAPNLKYISVLATAYGKIDTDYAKKKKIVVTNIPGYSTESVAELVFAVILENIRDIAKAKERGGRGNYSEAGLKATEIKGKVFAILGLGRIGGRVAEIAKGFGADVRYWSKNRKKESEKLGIKYQDADELITKADIISIHLAESPETKNFLNKKRINSMKPGALVISTVPNEIIDSDALEERLKKKDINFILDHTDELDPKDAKRLSKYENCILYPPIGYISDEARIAKQEIFIENIVSFLNGKPQNVVD